MKQRKHRHKESFSILLISNTGQNSRQFHVSRSFLRLLTVFVLLVCGAFGWLMYQYLYSHDGQRVYMNASTDADEDASQKELLEQLAAQEKLVQQLEEERDALNSQNTALTSENKALLAAAKSTKETGQAGAGDESSEADSSFPSRYPYSETGDVSEKYSEDHPYVSIDTGQEGDIVAAGDGTITMIGSDDSYPLIIEIEHGNSYKTRYMLLQDAEPLLEEGAQVQAGTALVSVDINNEQLDYQVIFKDEPIDPLIVFEAKG